MPKRVPGEVTVHPQQLRFSRFPQGSVEPSTVQIDRRGQVDVRDSRDAHRSRRQHALSRVRQCLDSQQQQVAQRVRQRLAGLAGGELFDEERHPAGALDYIGQQGRCGRLAAQVGQQRLHPRGPQWPDIDSGHPRAALQPGQQRPHRSAVLEQPGHSVEQPPPSHLRLANGA